jgi:hypothetical protein
MTDYSDERKQSLKMGTAPMRVLLISAASEAVEDVKTTESRRNARLALANLSISTYPC